MFDDDYLAAIEHRVSVEAEAAKKQGKKVLHKTVLKLQDIKFDQPLGYDLFTTRKMETGL